MKYSNISSIQLFLLALLMGIISAILVSINILYLDYRLLPKVYLATDGTCLKVVNYDNGQAFNCEDYKVILRRYRIEK